MSDPRLQGDAYQTYETDTYHAQGSESGPGVIAATLSIVTEDGAWVTRGGLRGTLADGTDAGAIFVGDGAYEGLIAIMTEPGAFGQVPRPEEIPAEYGPCEEVRGTIFDGAPVPEPYLPE
jgi:hypothetical protein